jgi:hypothetical protein
MWSKVFNAAVDFFKGALRFGAQVAPEIVGAYNPLLGLLTQKISGAILGAEAIEGVKGSQKWNIASLAMQAALPEIEHAFSAAGKPVKNPVLFAEGIAKIQQGIVDVFNSTGEAAKLPAPEEPGV